jgi:nucleotide-binding universal stress UspA family protein
MSPATEYRIVVGVDGSPDARAALDWALETASVNPPARLDLVHVWSLPASDGMVGAERFDVLRGVGQRLLDEAEEHAAAKRAAGHQVTTHLEYGAPAAGILARAEGAHLVVVGTRGRGRLRGALLGSVSRAVVTRATVPVAVVGRDAPAAVGPVLVGVDDSADARAALRWAAGHAGRRGAPLKVIHAFQPPHLAGMLGFARFQPDVAWRVEATKALARLVASELGEGAEHEVAVVAAQADPAAGLLAAAEDASLLVVGTRGRGCASSALLGSVSSQVLARARCPVVVVPVDLARPHPDRETGAMSDEPVPASTLSLR